MSTVASTPDLPSDPDELQAEIERRRVHLSQTVGELSARLAPSTLAAQAKEEAVGRARAAAYDESGNLRTERLAAVGAAFAAFVSLVVGLKVRRRRRRRRARRERELAAAVVVEPRMGRRRYRW